MTARVQPISNEAVVRFYAVLLRLSQRHETHGLARATYSQYARLMNCSLRSIQNYVRTLKSAGWIDTLPQPGEITVIRPLIGRDAIKKHYSATGRGSAARTATPAIPFGPPAPDRFIEVGSILERGQGALCPGDRF